MPLPERIDLRAFTEERTYMEHHTSTTLIRPTWLRRGVVAGVTLGAALGVVGTTTVSGASTPHTTPKVVISALKTKTDGTILASRTTLYTLAPSKVACTATCWKYWPPVLLPKGSMKAVAGKGVNARELSSVVVAGGRRQVTYAGKKLYWFVLDTAPGQVHGNLTNTWGRWADVVLAKPSTHSPTKPSSGGGAY